MSWWVIPEGTAGQTIGQLVQDVEHGSFALAGKGATFTVTQSDAKPSGAVEGPYSIQQDAQAEADKLNGVVTSSTQPTVPNLATSAASGFGLNDVLGPLFQKNIWLRVAEVGIGVVLLAIGLNAMLKGKPLQVVTSAAGAVGKAVP